MAGKVIQTERHGDYTIVVRGQYDSFGFDGEPEVTLQVSAFDLACESVGSHVVTVESPLTSGKVKKRADDLIAQMVAIVERKKREREITEGLPDSLDELLGGDGE